MKHIFFVIQARMNSTRLPGKVLRLFCGKPLLQFQTDILKKYFPDIEIVVATSTEKNDDLIENLCKKESISYIRGSENNVFLRYIKAVKAFTHKHIIRLTADNPIPDYKILSKCIKSHLQKQPDITSTREILPNREIIRYAPKGKSVDIIKTETLQNIPINTLNKFEKEHVIPYFYKKKFTQNIVKDFAGTENSFSIDTIDDFNKIETYTKQLIEQNKLYNVLKFTK